MSGNKIYFRLLRQTLAALCVALTSCARPHYRPAATAPAENAEQKPSPVCELQLKRLHLCVTLQWETLPREGTFGSLKLLFSKEDGSEPQLDSTFQPEVILFMPSMGHGSAKTSVQRATANTFLVTRVYFIMSGEWEIRVRHPVNGNEYDEAILPYTF